MSTLGGGLALARANHGRLRIERHGAAVAVEERGGGGGREGGGGGGYRNAKRAVGRSAAVLCFSSRSRFLSLVPAASSSSRTHTRASFPLARLSLFLSLVYAPRPAHVVSFSLGFSRFLVAHTTSLSLARPFTRSPRVSLLPLSLSRSMLLPASDDPPTAVAAQNSPTRCESTVQIHRAQLHTNNGRGAFGGRAD